MHIYDAIEYLYNVNPPIIRGLRFFIEVGGWKFLGKMGGGGGGELTIGGLSIEGQQHCFPLLTYGNYWHYWYDFITDKCCLPKKASTLFCSLANMKNELFLMRLLLHLSHISLGWYCQKPQGFKHSNKVLNTSLKLYSSCRNKDF